MIVLSQFTYGLNIEFLNILMGIYTLSFYFILYLLLTNKKIMMLISSISVIASMIVLFQNNDDFNMNIFFEIIAFFFIMVILIKIVAIIFGSENIILQSNLLKQSTFLFGTEGKFMQVFLKVSAISPFFVGDYKDLIFDSITKQNYLTKEP
jgi:hypothetical protein